MRAGWGLFDYNSSRAFLATRRALLYSPGGWEFQMSKLDDYGGDQYGRRYRTKRTAENIRSYNCLHCDKLFYLSHLASLRVGGVRCPNCGGTGEETDPSIKRRLGVKKADVARLAGEIGKINVKRSGSHRFVSVSNKPYECIGCGKQFRTQIGLKLHCEDHPEHLSAAY